MRARIRPDLGCLRSALDHLDNPQTAFPSILIVGTNGKGSTAVMLEAVLQAHGLRTGLFTSPHLVRLEERIRLGNSAPKVDDALVERCLRRAEGFTDLTYFESATAAAFLAFAEAGVQCAVLEAGMGGTWDATRLAGSAVVGLTNVGTDHREWLGRDRAAIAKDKGAALAAARRGVIGPGVDSAILDFLNAPAAERATDLVQPQTRDDHAVSVLIDSDRLSVTPPLAGAHQIDNLVLALALACCAVDESWLPCLRPEAVVSGLDSVVWPGRWTRHRVAGRSVTLDCAHNLEAAQTLVGLLEAQDERYNLVFSCLEDKPVDEIAGILRPLVEQVAICPLEDERAMAVDRIARAFPDAIRASNPLDALTQLPDPVLAAGSLRLVGALIAEEEKP